MRKRLSNRRPHRVEEFVHNNIKYFGQYSFDMDTQNVSEIFLQAGKAGSPIEAMARDSAVAVSLLLQHGCSLQTLRDALTRTDDGSAAGPLGVLLDIIIIKQGENSGAKS